MKLAKNYEPNQYEEDVYALWEKEQAFAPKARGSKQTYSIVVPPPNANGDLHIGHGLNMAIMDIATRYHRMKGEASLLLPGADHAGLETWVVYEKHLIAKGKSRFDYSREELYQQIWDFVALNRDNYQQQFRKLGASVDWTRYVYTLDQKIVDQAYSSFEKMWKEGLIYRAEKLVNFCTYHGTGFSDIEVAYKESPGHLWYIRYPLTDGTGEIIVATTRPETMLGDTAVAVHPEDKRYKKFIGKTITLPLSGREVPVISDDYVDMEYGTGAVKITPAHDPNDFAIGERHKLDMITVIGFDGKMTDQSPSDYQGLDVISARKQVISDLDKDGMLEKTEDISHNVGHCYKCDTVIEPLLREQWFVDLEPLAKPAIAALKQNKIDFMPESKRKQLITYLENIRDWNISRQIAWGIPIPAFQNVDDPTDWIFSDKVEQETISVNGKTYQRDSDVFDTWFSSSSWPYATLDFPDGKDFNDFYPLSLMETGADILYPWVSRMIMFGLYNTGKVPFENVYLHGLIQSADGQKMSKSKGNVVNPMDKVDQFGSDAFRIGMIMGESAGGDRPYDESKVVGGRNFCNKLWNIARFIEGLGDVDLTDKPPKSAGPADEWVLGRLSSATTRAGKHLDNYQFSEAYDTVYHLIWDDFADWYIEVSKQNPNKEMLGYVLQAVLKLAHPFAPFVTETIWQTLHPDDDNLLIINSWPQAPKFSKQGSDDFEKIKTIVSEIRFIKTQLSLGKITLYHSGSDFLERSAEIIARLSHLEAVRAIKDGSGLHLTQTSENCWLGVDFATARQFVKQLEDKQQNLDRQIKTLKGRLNSENYVKKAPKKLVDESREQLKRLKSEKTTVAGQISSYRGSS